MISMFYIGTTVALLYGLLSVVSSVIQLKVKALSVWLSASMLICGLMIILSTLLLLFYVHGFMLLIVGLLFMHVLAVLNGYFLYRKIHVTHHVIRLFVSLFVIGVTIPNVLNI